MEKRLPCPQLLKKQWTVFWHIFFWKFETQERGKKMQNMNPVHSPLTGMPWGGISLTGQKLKAAALTLARTRTWRRSFLPNGNSWRPLGREIVQMPVIHLTRNKWDSCGQVEQLAWKRLVNCYTSCGGITLACWECGQRKNTLTANSRTRNGESDNPAKRRKYSNKIFRLDGGRKIHIGLWRNTSATGQKALTPFICRPLTRPKVTCGTRKLHWRKTVLPLLWRTWHKLQKVTRATLHQQLGVRQQFRV